MEKNGPVICDTNVLIEFYKGNPEIITEIKAIGYENINVSIISCAELVFGAFDKAELRQLQINMDDLKKLPVT